MDDHQHNFRTVNLETYSSVPVTALRGKERPRAVNDTTVRAAFKCVPKKDVNRKCLNIENFGTAFREH